MQLLSARRPTKFCHQALDDRIDEFGEIIREHYKTEELGDPASSTDACRFVTFSLTTLLNLSLGRNHHSRPHNL